MTARLDRLALQRARLEELEGALRARLRSVAPPVRLEELEGAGSAGGRIARLELARLLALSLLPGELLALRRELEELRGCWRLRARWRLRAILQLLPPARLLADRAGLEEELRLLLELALLPLAAGLEPELREGELLLLQLLQQLQRIGEGAADVPPS